MKSRKGDWIQIFMIILFALVVLVSLLLLGLQRASTDPVDMESLEQDILDQQAKMVLINWLRTPAEVNLAQGFPESEQNIAVLLAVSEPSTELDEKLSELLWTNGIPGYYVLNIKYAFDESDYNNFMQKSMLQEPSLRELLIPVVGSLKDKKDLPENTYFTRGWVYTSDYGNFRDIGVNDCDTYTGVYQRKENVIMAATYLFDQALEVSYGRAQVMIPGKNGNVLVQIEYVDSITYMQWNDMGRRLLRHLDARGFSEIGRGKC